GERKRPELRSVAHLPRFRSLTLPVLHRYALFAGTLNVFLAVYTMKIERRIISVRRIAIP
ncbi:MAG: hypothetical protein L0220_32445, partial [Acidobacteria bacterium]|nr:hypothetical protein [Acidobacteriota bacterium]